MGDDFVAAELRRLAVPWVVLPAELELVFLAWGTGLLALVA